MKAGGIAPERRASGASGSAGGEPGDDLCDHPAASLLAWHQQLLDRRRFLIGAAGGALTLLFGRAGKAVGSDDADASDALSEAQRWELIEVVQQQLFPSEADAPGARELNAREFLQRAMAEPDRDPQEGAFILQGAGWLQQLAQQDGGQGFAALDPPGREALLRRIAASQAGENWLSTLLLFILQALLTDPIYGGNPGGIGWAWLRHTPGFPQPEQPYYQLPFFRV
jgi:gluconate 2-dehydrogenase gamma chain